MPGEVFFQFQHIDVVVSVLIGIANGQIPHPKVSKALSDGPIAVSTTVIFEDGDVAGFTGRSALVIGLERVVLLINDDVNGVVAGEFTHFYLLNVGELIPIGVSALITSDPDVLSLVEDAVSVVVENRHAVGAVGRNGQVVVPITIKVANGDVRGVAVCGV